MTGTLARGEVWWTFLEPVIGTEQAGRRPTLILSRTGYNQTAVGRVIIVPLTSKFQPFPTYVPIREASGLGRPTWALVDQVRAVDKRRLRRFIGTVDPETVEDVQLALGRLLFEP